MQCESATFPYLPTATAAYALLSSASRLNHAETDACLVFDLVLNPGVEKFTHCLSSQPFHHHRLSRHTTLSPAFTVPPHK